MNDEFEMAKELHAKLGQGSPPFPVGLFPTRRLTYMEIMTQEAIDFARADDVSSQAAAIITSIYVALTVLDEMGVKPDGLFELVHEAHMRKVWNGKVRQDASATFGESREAVILDIQKKLAQRVADYAAQEEEDNQRRLPFS